MGVTVFNDKYVRVTRAWNKEETQIYVPIKKSLKAALKEAEQIDKKLAESQKAFMLRQELTGDRLFHEDGSIVGLRIVTRHRDGRKPSNEITLRVKVPEHDKPFFSNVSLDKHGFDQAFKLAVDKICEWNNIDVRSPVRQRLLDAAAAHKKEYNSVVGGKAAKAKAAKEGKPTKAKAKPATAKAKPATAKAAKPSKEGKPAKAAAKKAAAKAAKAAVKAVKPTKAAKAKTVKPAKAVKAAKSSKGKEDDIYSGLMKEVKSFQGKKKNTIRG